MIKEAETEKTKLVCHIFIISSISIGGEGRGGLPGPPGYVYALHALSILKKHMTEFDGIKLWKVLHEYGVDDQLLRATTSFSCEPEVCVRMNGK